MTVDDLAEKLDCTRVQATYLVEFLKREGTLASKFLYFADPTRRRPPVTK